MLMIRGRDLILPLTEMTAGKLAMVMMSRFCFISQNKERVGSVPTVLLTVADIIQL
jgi:hypothetical protein